MQGITNQAHITVSNVFFPDYVQFGDGKKYISMNHAYNYRQNISPCVKVKHKQHRMGGDLVVDFDDKI